MRPVRIITAVVFAAAVAVTGCAAHSTAVNPPVTPVVDAPTPPAPNPAPKPIPIPVPAPKAPVLADGHYDAYIQQVNTRGDYLVVDLVQVFEGQAAIDAAIADGLPATRPRCCTSGCATRTRGCEPWRWPATCVLTSSPATASSPGTTSSPS
jgi:hypothetical protein